MQAVALAKSWLEAQEGRGCEALRCLEVGPTTPCLCAFLLLLVAMAGAPNSVLVPIMRLQGNLM